MTATKFVATVEFTVTLDDSVFGKNTTMDIIRDLIQSEGAVGANSSIYVSTTPWCGW